MRKNLTILCDDDSLQYQYERQIQTAKHQRISRSPLSKTGKDFNLMQSMTSCQTPQSRQYPRQSFEFKSPKYAGIIEKNVLQRLVFYDQKHKQKKQNQDLAMRIREEQFGIKQLRQKPEINEISKNLFQKVKKQRKLSPNILERFQTYECERLSRNAKYELLKTYGMEIKNTASTCKKNINKTCRSPLKQNNANTQKSRSKSKSLLKKTIKHPENFGKIVYRKPKEHQTEKKQQRFATSGRYTENHDTYLSLTPKGKSNFQKTNEFYQEDLNEQQLSFNQHTPKKKIGQILYKDKTLSPICQKKPKSQKWRVIA